MIEERNAEPAFQRADAFPENFCQFDLRPLPLVPVEPVHHVTSGAVGETAVPHDGFDVAAVRRQVDEVEETVDIPGGQVVAVGAPLHLLLQGGELRPITPGNGFSMETDRVLGRPPALAVALGGLEGLLRPFRQGMDGVPGLGHDHAGGKMDLGVFGDIDPEVFGHCRRQFLGGAPGADQEEIVATGKDRVSVRILFPAEGGQPDREKGVQLAGKGRHLGKGAVRAQTLLEDPAEIVDITLQGGEGDLPEPPFPARCLVPSFDRHPVFAGQVVEGLGVTGTIVVLLLDSLVLVAHQPVVLVEAWHIGVDVATGVAVPEVVGQAVRQAEIPAAHQLPRPGEWTEPAGDLLFPGETDTVAEDTRFQRFHPALAQVGILSGNQQPVPVGQGRADFNLVTGQRCGTPVIGRQPVVVGAHSLRVGHVEHGWRLAGEIEAAELFPFQVGKQPLHQPGIAAGEEVVAAGGLPDQPKAGLTEGVFEEPAVDVLADSSELFPHIGGVGRDNEEFSRRVDDLRGRGQFECFQHLEGGQFGEQRDHKRAAAQQFGRLFVGLGAVRENEFLDAEKITLDEQQLVLTPVGSLLMALNRILVRQAVLGDMPAPECHRKSGCGLAVVVERDLRPHPEGRGRGDGVGVALPEGVEVVEPQGPGGAVRLRDLLQRGKEPFPQVPVLRLGRAILRRFVALPADREQVLR